INERISVKYYYISWYQEPRFLIKMPPKRNNNIYDVYERIVAIMDERLDQFVDQFANRMNDMMNPKRRGYRNSRRNECEESKKSFFEGDGSSLFVEREEWEDDRVTEVQYLMMIHMKKRLEEVAEGREIFEATFPLLEDFLDVFLDELPNALPPLCDIQHHIDLEPSLQLPNMSCYRLCPGEHEELRRQNFVGGLPCHGDSSDDDLLGNSRTNFVYPWGNDEGPSIEERALLFLEAKDRVKEKAKNEGKESENPFFKGDDSSLYVERKEWEDDHVADDDYEEGPVFDDDGEEDNIEDIVVVANDICSSMIQTSINVDFSKTIDSNPRELIWLQKGNLVEINILIAKKYQGYLKAKPMDDKFGFKMIKCMETASPEAHDGVTLPKVTASHFQGNDVTRRHDDVSLQSVQETLSQVDRVKASQNPSDIVTTYFLYIQTLCFHNSCVELGRAIVQPL
nr:putative reverse transcriptase domain-containing protein [Tanacetum cinerariifolium]